MGECRAGLRRHSGTDRGDRYQRILAHHGTGNADDPEVYERTLGDLVTPTRPTGPTDVVNAVVLETAADAETWRLERLLSMVATINQREPRPSDLS